MLRNCHQCILSCARSPIKKSRFRVTQTEPYINESDIPKDCFEPISAETNPKDTDLNPVSIEMPLSPQPQKEKESNKESDQEKTKNQLRKPLLSTMKLCLVQKKFYNIEREMERWSPWSSGSPILRTNQRGNRNTIFWTDVSLIIIFNHRNNYIFFTLPCCLAYISLIFSYPWIELGYPQNISVHEFLHAFSPFL